MPAGRPPKYETVEALEEVIEEYFKSDAWVTVNDEKVYRPTMSGLAYALGLSRQGLCEYSHKDLFSDAIKSARERVEIALEQNLYNSAVTGTIFNLKNNFGWRDKTEQEIKATVDMRDVSEMTNEELEAELNRDE